MSNAVTSLRVPPQVTSLSHLLQYRAQQHPDGGITYLPAGEGEERPLTYAALDLGARRLAQRLTSVAQPGERALLLYGEGVEIATAFFGALYAGLVTVPVSPPRPNQPHDEVRGLAEDAGVTLVLTEQRLEPLAAALFAGTGVQVMVTDQPDDGEDSSTFVPVAVAPSALASLLYTSGSTRRPRGVMLSHGHLMSRLIATDAIPSLNSAFDGPTVSWMPLQHIWGLTAALLQPMYRDLPAIVMPTSAVMQKPVRWLRAISHYRAVSSGAPNFAFQACLDAVSDEDCAGLDLSTWQLAPLGAETIRADTLEQFAARFAPYGFTRHAFRTAYGMSEGMATFDLEVEGDKPRRFLADRTALEADRVQPAADAAAAQELVSCGAPMPGQEIVIVDPEQFMPLGEGRVGEVWNRGPLVADGYWNQPEQTEQTFRGHLAGGDGPYLRTGDLGFMHGGELFIIGRLKDMLIIRGKNLYAVDLEHTAEQAHPALLPAASAAFSVPVGREEQLVLVHEVRPDLHVDVNEVAAAVRRRIGDVHQLPVHAVVLVASGSVPRTHTGKLQRYRCREAYLASVAPPAPTPAAAR
ncbi:acyl-CoA synthetase (AMP-forming)/AMP-acid ligase II [Deinococcus metalli]|uniref:Acyl-CoA synthetase n=1 Tax=Deinococcus metalli TaxID=1141878 RepID=A0A7W8NP67_9DEIO|nr:fatty acyl-AMP ligase [Deinococcus metalli]MBB5376491.1 acyl-CoA synthetase (AMP-forming)/AMP-acid ligase II [Deinococcus metalli]GHF43640.1 acyl-CoA synthetase [Deinococcus metalli]